MFSQLGAHADPHALHLKRRAATHLTEMDQQQFLVWSPCAVIAPFNPMITPTMSVLPLTPFISTSLFPHQAMTPTLESAGSLAPSTPLNQVANISPNELSVSPVPAQGMLPYNQPIPILGPAPGSKESATPRKRFRTQLGSSITQAESPSKQHAKKVLGNRQVVIKQELVDAVPVIELSQVAAPKTLVKQEFIEGVSQLEHADISSSEDESYDPKQDNDPEVKFRVDRGRRRSTKKRARFGLNNNVLDGILIEGGLTSPISRQRMFYCPSCNKGYKFRKHCRRHMISHTGNKPFGCEICKKTFTRQDSLQRHQPKCQSKHGELDDYQQYTC